MERNVGGSRPLSPRRIKKDFFRLKLEENNLYQNLLCCFEQNYPARNRIFKKYSEKILTVSLFLFTTSSFLYKNRKKNMGELSNFHWRNHIQKFPRRSMLDFVNCSLLYMIEYNHFLEVDKKEIKSYLPKELPSFERAYYWTVLKKYSSNNRRENLIGLPFDKYIELISLSLRLFELIRYEIPKNYSKVIELIELSDNWKKKVTEIFNYSAEYIAFLYFINIRKRGGFFQSKWIRFLWIISLIFK
ncbi:hypothetical protein [Candidatus Mycoplasma haematominutum]|uniref:Uncharacterized protein n=1 Tax=Candidatus Mycoplasma haematominutum 'Birmingham 1' TaxID=1116213 RepID=G8C387_9MOLU|nr:hypothetical protein [Candidatus Mycoplasma haematominutum]CCE66785.1 conserved haemoplasma hypothetical protein [Candidatus Mycoplasma haematominutum 'Birmingham 1']